ncbi:putative PKS/NRPS-like protein biosynthetic cluster [Aspergillus brasiliensis]|nr:putative PKS/NRPS-like protein biosynthetic cluster [Aspergillus brasiliensis]
MNNPPAPIAVVGMSCRLPGQVRTSMTSGLSYQEVAMPGRKGCFNVKGGYFRQEDLSQLDAPFFHITQPEAISTDPQQRQLLECAYEAIENAGYPLQSIAGSRMGVFVGLGLSDYRRGEHRDLSTVSLFDATGGQEFIQAGRLSHFFNLRGPSVAIDTACSSSLYALHMAVQCIRSGEADSALIAATKLRIQPDDMVSMSMMG